MRIRDRLARINRLMEEIRETYKKSRDSLQR